jgi:3' exoribonuclease, RNase T-like
MIDIMIDLETLGRRPGCKILSLGAVTFGLHGLGREFYAEAKHSDQGLLAADQETLVWWSEQDELARTRLFNDQDKKPTLRQLLSQFNDWLIDVAGLNDRGRVDARIWGNGADFDNAILQVAYVAVAQADQPWDFWNNRCYRTLKGLAPTIKMTRVGTHHNALNDAESQATHAVQLLNHLQAW